MSVLKEKDAALVMAALAIPDGDDRDLLTRFTAAHANGVAPVALDELTLMAVLFCGFPRALVASRILRRVTMMTSAEDGAAYEQWEEWSERGEETCHAVYRENYDKLRAHVADLHPALDAWMIVDGYGRTMGRKGLDLLRRELCAIALLIPQRAPRQLHSHLRGALNVGASRTQVEKVLAIAAGDPLITKDQSATARRLWQEIVAKHPAALGTSGEMRKPGDRKTPA